MNTSTSSLAGRTAVVTGSTSGIGAATAHHLAGRGARVVVTGRDADRGAEVVDAITASGGSAVFVVGDLTSAPAELRELATAWTAALDGRIDILVHNAAVCPAVDTLSLTDDDLETTLAVNVRAPQVLTAAIAPAMVAHGSGAIVVVGSWMASVGHAFVGFYSATKAAEAQLARSWAAEFGPRGVRVNTVAPGATRTPINAGDDDVITQMTSTTPAGRPGTPDEVAAAIWVAGVGRGVVRPRSAHPRRRRDHGDPVGRGGHWDVSRLAQLPGMQDHAHGHSHAHICGGPDHHRGDYTEQQRADLDLVLAFNRRMSEAINSRFDVRAVEEVLDPDPLRFMWVDEGKGMVAEMMAGAHAVLDQAPRHDGHARAGVDVVPGAQNAARPSIAVGPDGTRLVAWTEWIPDRGEHVRVALGDQVAAGESDVVSGEVADVYRPTAVVTTGGVAWVLFGRRDDGDVAVWGTRWTGERWTDPEPVTDGGHPAFNQEVVALPDGGLEVCWQARHDDRFAIFARRWSPTGGWGATVRVSTGVEANVWDPSVTAFADGSTAYAWSEYADGAYRVVVRRRSTDGELLDPQDLTSGSDYALHPHLAVTRDQQLWCAFDLITVVGHGGSGPTKLRPLADVGADPAVVEGMRPGSENVPPELLPDVSASIRVVAVTEHGILDAPGELAPTLDVVPAGLPKLVATEDGGLVVAYRIHRRLPLMTYYWEVAAQTLGPGGWLPPTTFSGTDGTLEEISAAAGSGSEVVIAAQTDERLRVALDWTEGFGGRECPYLHDHHGAVVWHGVHGIGTVVLGRTASAGAALTPSPARSRTSRVHAGDREDARRWAEPAARSGRTDRYAITTGDRTFQLYWGDLHRHSLVSRCTAGDEPSLEDFYRYAWDVCEYDFWAVTDHSENSSDHQWWSIQKIADLFHIDDRFVPLYGFEWTSADSGHQNVIYGDVPRGAPIFSAFAEGTTDPAGLWEQMEQHPDFPAITIPHHPGSAMVYNDWDYHHADYSRLVEIFQACRGNYESLGAFRQYSDATKEGTFVLDGLRRGHRFGFIASSDHGHGASYVGAFAESLDRASIFEALHSRRTFAATTRDVLIDVRIGEALMGEAVVPAGPATLRVHAEGYTDLARVDILRDGVVVHATEPGHDVPDGQVAVPLRVEWGGSDRTTVWDGTLSVSGGAHVVRTPFWSPEIVEVREDSVRWACTTASFGEPYGSQRGGIEVTVVGPPDATVALRVGDRSATISLAALLESPVHDLPGGGGLGHVRLQPGIGGLTGLGTTSLDLTWTDPAPVPADGSAFYYARVFQVDGEMAWSSPIWLDPAH